MQKSYSGTNKLFRIKVNKKNLIFTNKENENVKLNSKTIDADFNHKNNIFYCKYVRNSMSANKSPKSNAIKNNIVIDKMKLINNFNVTIPYQRKNYHEKINMNTPLNKKLSYETINNNSVQNYHDSENCFLLLNKYLRKLLDQFIKHFKKSYLSLMKMVFNKLKYWDKKITRVKKINQRKNKNLMSLTKNNQNLASPHFILKTTSNSLNKNKNYKIRRGLDSLHLHSNNKFDNDDTNGIKNFELSNEKNRTLNSFNQVKPRKIKEVKINKSLSSNKNKQSENNSKFKISASNYPRKKIINRTKADINIGNSFYEKGINIKTKLEQNESSLNNIISAKNKSTIYYKDSPLFQIKSKIINDDDNSYRNLCKNFEKNVNKKMRKSETRIYYLPVYQKNKKSNFNYLINNTNCDKEKYKLIQEDFMESLDRLNSNSKNKKFKKVKNENNRKKIFISKIVKNIKTKDDKINIRINYIFNFPNRKTTDKYRNLKIENGYSFTYSNLKIKKNWTQNKIYRKKVLFPINDEGKKSKIKYPENCIKHSHNEIFEFLKTVDTIYINAFKKKFIKNLKTIDLIIKCYIFEKLIKLFYFKKICSILNKIVKVQDTSSNFVNDNIEIKSNKSSSNIVSGDSSDLVLSLYKDAIIDNKFLSSISELNNNINHNNQI